MQHFYQAEESFIWLVLGILPHGNSGHTRPRVLISIPGQKQHLLRQRIYFVAEHTYLADGTVLISGGTLQYNGNPDNCNGLWHGLNAAYELRPSSETLTKVTNMRHGRWYPTLVTST